MNGQVRGVMAVLGRRSDPPKIELLREKVRTGHSYGGDEFVREAKRLTGRQLNPFPAGRPR